MECKSKKGVEDANKKEKYEANLEQALDVAGFGWYNLKYCVVLALFLTANLVELIGYSLVLPAAICDLDMSDTQRGLIASSPYIGILLTSYPWGYLVDTQGRKKPVIYSSFIAGFFSLLSGLMPGLTSFAICKFLVSLCSACPSTAPYSYIGEILPAKYRDVTLSVINAAQITGSALVPLFAWAILPLDFRISLGIYIFRPWRLLSLVYAMCFIIPAILLLCGPESPKFLVSQEKCDEALVVLQNIYAGNKGKKPEDFPINKLIVPPNNRKKGSFLTSLKVQTVPLLKWHYLKWMILNGFLFFGVFAILNGLNMWVPDVLNRVLTTGGEGKTACQVIFDRLNQTSSEHAVCDDSIDEITLIINSIGRVSCAVIAIAISLVIKFIGKKQLLCMDFLLIGAFCTLINFTTNDILFSILLSSTPLLCLAMGPISAYAVEIFPTHLRGMAMSLSMMVGRTGSIIGNNIAGLLINNACEVMFYTFGGLLFLCFALSFLLPNSSASNKKQQDLDNKIVNTP